MSTGKVTVGYERLQGRDHIRGIECFSLLDFQYFVIEKITFMVYSIFIRL